MRSKLIFIVFSIGLITFQAKGQTLPVGTPALSEAYRNAQLLGQIDTTISFTVLPVFPIKALNTDHPFDPLNNLGNEKWVKSDSIIHLYKNHGRVQLLPFTWTQQFNTHNPYSLNDGPMIPARGYQTMMSGGIFAEIGILNIQLRPEYVYAENRNFQGLYKELPENVWTEYNYFHSVIDFPEKFGDKPYKKLFWGQSSIRLTAGSVSVGLSNENLWWGPGIKNAMVMSNTAPGFVHITLNTVKPIHTFIGSFEGQIIGGKLENSGYQMSARQNSRYINGFVITYNPRWIPGLFLGLTRTEIAYYNDLKTFFDFVPVLTPFFKNQNYSTGESPYPNDQRLSIFSRWLLPKAHAEIYGEFFREDHAYDFRDIALQMEYTHAYLIGLTKLIPIISHPNQFMKFQVEYTKIEQNEANPWRGGGSLYVHYAGVSQGYTNKGQLLGPGIGPGSDLLSFEFSWIKGLKKIGIEFERFVHNNDFFNTVIIDPRAKWVDLNISAIGQWNWKNLMFSSKLTFQNAYNYEYYYKPVVTENNSSYWAPGTNTFNFQTQVSMTYLF